MEYENIEEDIEELEEKNKYLVKYYIEETTRREIQVTLSSHDKIADDEIFRNILINEEQFVLNRGNSLIGRKIILNSNKFSDVKHWEVLEKEEENEEILTLEKERLKIFGVHGEPNIIQKPLMEGYHQKEKEIFLDKCKNVARKDLVIIDVDMILTDILFRVNNVDPTLDYTLDSKMELTSYDFEELQKTGHLDVGDFFFERNFYKNASMKKDVFKLVKALKPYQSELLDYVMFTHTGPNVSKEHIEYKVNFIKRVLSEIKIFNKPPLAIEIFSNEIKKIDVFKEKYSCLYDLKIVTDDSINTVKQYAEYDNSIMFINPGNLLWKEALERVYSEMNLVHKFY